MKEFVDAKAVELGKQSEMLMVTDHWCNIGIKTGLKGPKGGLEMCNPKTGMVHIIKTAEDVIEFNDASMTTLE